MAKKYEVLEGNRSWGYFVATCEIGAILEAIEVIKENGMKCGDQGWSAVEWSDEV